MEEPNPKRMHELANALEYSIPAQSGLLHTRAKDYLRDAADRIKEMEAKRGNESFSPDWSKAPQWANFYAVSARGAAIWFREQPTFRVHGRYWLQSDGMAQSAGIWSEGVQEPFCCARPDHEMECDGTSVDKSIDDIKCRGELARTLESVYDLQRRGGQ